GYGVFAFVFVFTGIEIDVFAYVQVEPFEERLNNGVRLRILTTVFVEVVVLGDEVIELCPDLCGGAGVGGCTGRDARVCTGAVRSCVDEVDIAGALRDIDQVVPAVTVTVEVTIVYVRGHTCGSGFENEADDRSEMFGVFDAVVAVGNDAIGLVPGRTRKYGCVGVRIGDGARRPQGAGGAAGLHGRSRVAMGIS